jgi:hypothetical protein
MADDQFAGLKFSEGLAPKADEPVSGYCESVSEPRAKRIC